MSILDFFTKKKEIEEMKSEERRKQAKDLERKATWELAELLRQDPNAREFQAQLEKDMTELNPEERVAFLMKRMNANLESLNQLLKVIKGEK